MTYHNGPKMGLKFQLNQDLVMRVVFEKSALKQSLEDTARATTMNWPITRIGQIETHKNRLKERDQRMGPTYFTGKGGTRLQRGQNG
jgi:hypothetical protein